MLFRYLVSKFFTNKILDVIVINYFMKIILLSLYSNEEQDKDNDIVFILKYCFYLIIY